MQRYFIEDMVSVGQTIELTKEQAHHIQRVLRMTEGDLIEIVDGTEQLYQATIHQLTPVMVTVTASLPQQVELPVQVTLYVGLSKGDKLDWIVQKATEMGAYAIVPVAMKRNMVKWTSDKSVKKIERLQKIALEAAEQSHRLHIPTIKPLLTLEEAIQEASMLTAALVAYEEVAKEGESSQFTTTLASLHRGDTLGFFFGPEGGLEEWEVKQMREAGIFSCALGPRILRAETAPLYAMAAISYHCELLA